jgi:hypothetical protein
VALETLSSILNKMHRLNGGGGSDRLRNHTGVYLKVMIFRSSDPAYLDQGKVGMLHGNSLEGILWAEYGGRPTDLATDAESIRQTVIGADEMVLAMLPPVGPYEGGECPIMRLYKPYKRDPLYVRKNTGQRSA